jgi:hypothetical protein
MLSLTKTALERLLTTERHRRQANQSTLAGFAQPMISERALEPALAEPMAVTDARGNLVPTSVSRTRGVARYGFFECTTDDEGPLLRHFFAALWEMSVAKGWDNRCTSLAEASAKMKLEPRSIVVPYGLVEKVSSLTREEADRLMGLQGYISSGDQQILVSDLPDGHALLAAAPALLGFYTRIDDRLGVLLTRIDQTVFLVREAP